MKNQKDQYIQLPTSLRKYIRRKKAEIRREHGINSEQEEELMQWIQEKREQKHKRIEG